MTINKLGTIAKVLERVPQDGDAWIHYCDALAELFGGVGTSLVPVDVPRRAFRTYYSPSLNDVLAEYQRDGWYDKDYRQRSAPILLERGYALDTDIVTREQMDKLPYYRDFLRKHGVGGFLGIHLQTRYGSWCAAIQLPLGRLTPDEADLALVPDIRHMTETVAERAALEGMAQRQVWSGSLKTTGHESAIVNASGEILAKSGGLDRLLMPLGNIRDRFVLHDPVVQKRMEKTLSGCFDPALDALLPEPVFLVSGKLRIVVTFFRYPSKTVHFFDSPEILVLFRPVSVSSEGAAGSPAQQFGLTRSEMELVQELLRGTALKVAAANLHITEGTARQRLKSIFRKTRTESQHQLVAMLYQSAGFSIESLFAPRKNPII